MAWANTKEMILSGQTLHAQARKGLEPDSSKEAERAFQVDVHSIEAESERPLVAYISRLPTIHVQYAHGHRLN